eukprot:1066634_1
MSNTIYYCKQTMNVTIDMNACDKSKAEIVALREQHQSVLSKWSAKHHTVLQSILTECDEYTAICATFNECKQRLVTSETQYQSLLRQYTCVLKDFKTGEMVHKDASRDCKCTEYKEPIPMNRPLPTGHYMSQAQEHIEMVLFKNPNYCFDEDSLQTLFGVETMFVDRRCCKTMLDIYGNRIRSAMYCSSAINAKHYFIVNVD